MASDSATDLTISIDLTTSVKEAEYDDEKERDSQFKTANDIFNCIMCGECCNGFGGTYVKNEDIERISAFIHCDSAEFRAKFCNKSGSKLVLSQSENGKCIFFDSEKQCTIHPVKPRMCRNWPFILTIISHPENWNVMADSCPGMKKNIPYETLRRIVSEKIKRQETD
ncbi:MAG: YkgJ family cysteine cluster protein [Desulfamplus sp.]|nr:YkgJ family cysteine cluster protein [Desulfamplus sp.]